MKVDASGSGRSGYAGKKRLFYGLRGSKLNMAIAILAGLDFLLFGYDQGVMGGLLTLPIFLDRFPQIDTNLGTPEEQSTASNVQGIAIGSYNLGCFCGAIATIWIGNLLGRRKAIFLGSFVMIIGATLQAASFGLPQLVVGRIVTGFGNGINTSTVPTWQSECSKSHQRGKLVMIEGALITGGICLSYWLDFGMSFAPGEAAWRFPIAFQAVFAIIIVALILGLPESPRWLILKGRDEDARIVLAALSNTTPDDHFVAGEFQAVKDTTLEMARGSFRDLFNTTNVQRNFHRTVLGYVNQVFQQISGINLITYYAATIYQNSIGLSGFLSRILAAANGTEYFLASWFAVFTIEKIGRRPLMLVGAAGMSLSMVVLAICTSFQGTERAFGAGIGAAVFLFVFNTFFAIGWLGMTWLYPAEIVPLRIRAPANALSTSANWLFNFMVVMITPVAFKNIQYKTYIIFAVINAFIFPVVYFFYPETKYRSLEEMDGIFAKANDTKNPWLSVVHIARTEPRRFGKNGEMLIDYNDTEFAQRRGSVASAGRQDEKHVSHDNAS